MSVVGIAVGVLGPLQVLVDGVDVTPVAPKERALLAVLAVNHGQVVGAERLIEELWPELPASRARHALQVRVTVLRRLLRNATAAPVLQFVTPGYRLLLAADDIDRYRFELGRAGSRSIASR